VDETDELLMAEEDEDVLGDVPPELLPRRVLDNFAFYNSEVGNG
jgi:hypothetical protein